MISQLGMHVNQIETRGTIGRLRGVEVRNQRSLINPRIAMTLAGGEVKMGRLSVKTSFWMVGFVGMLSIRVSDGRETLS